jgi:IS1 family transposase
MRASRSCFNSDQSCLKLLDTFRMAIGARTKASARRLWASLPGVYRQCAVCYTDFWKAYAAILPSKRHRAVGQESGQTSHIERFNNTLRQRCSRLVRKTLSYSKRLAALKAACAWEDWVYNLTRSVDTLSLRVQNGQQRWKRQTPAMAAQMTDHVWTIKELLMTVVPPSIINN